MPYANTYIDNGNHDEDIALITTTTTTTRCFHLVDDRLATAMYLMRSSFSMVLKASLAALAFSHDMFMNTPLINI